MALCLLAGQSPAPPPAPGGILLVTVDTLRADRLGPYGHIAARTPVLDALAARGVRFADATAHAPRTHPSHAAVMTGRYPGAFGITLNGMTPLPPDAVTLAERVKAAGRATGAVVATVILDEAYGMAQGVDSYDDRMAAAGGDVALPLLTKAVALNPDDPRARANLGEAAMRLRSYEIARQSVEKLVALEYRVADAHFNLGVIAEARRDLPAARRHCGAALKANPRYGAARKALARIGQ